MPIPNFPEFKPLGIEDKNEIESSFRRSNPTNSESTFTNLFMWRLSYHFQVSMYLDKLFILAHPEDGVPFFLPPAGDDISSQDFKSLLDFMQDKGWVPRIKSIPKDMIDRSRLWEDDRFNVRSNRDDSDYVYLVQSLIDLSGRKFHKKKNQLNQFLKNNAFVFEYLSGKNRKGCLQMEESWCDFRRCEERPGLIREMVAIREALNNLESLSCTGGVILIDGKIEAFSLGEALNNDTAVVHIEKANPGIQGLYVAINQQSCEHLWADFTYINREQDLGEEGLRRAKLSYNPSHLIEKYTITPRRSPAIKRPLKNAQFCSRSRQAKILTGGIH